MLVIPDLPAQRLVQLRGGVKVHRAWIGEHILRQPHEQNRRRTDRHRMRAVELHHPQRGGAVQPERIAPAEHIPQRPQEQVPDAGHTQRHHRRLEHLAMGQKRLIDVERPADAARHHPPCAEEQREEANAPSAIRQMLPRPAQDVVAADGHRADGQRVRDRRVPVVVVVAAAQVHVDDKRQRHARRAYRIPQRAVPAASSEHLCRSKPFGARRTVLCLIPRWACLRAVPAAASGQPCIMKPFGAHRTVFCAISFWV